jgi:hypothetical protein
MMQMISVDGFSAFCLRYARVLGALGIAVAVAVAIVTAGGLNHVSYSPLAATHPFVLSNDQTGPVERLGRPTFLSDRLWHPIESSAYTGAPAPPPKPVHKIRAQQ